MRIVPKSNRKIVETKSMHLRLKYITADFLNLVLTLQ